MGGVNHHHTLAVSMYFLLYVASRLKIALPSPALLVCARTAITYRCSSKRPWGPLVAPELEVDAVLDEEVSA